MTSARSWAERRPNSSARHGAGISAAGMRCQAWPILTIHLSSMLVLRIHWRQPQRGGTPPALHDGHTGYDSLSSKQRTLYDAVVIPALTERGEELKNIQLINSNPD